MTCEKVVKVLKKIVSMQNYCKDYHSERDHGYRQGLQFAVDQINHHCGEKEDDSLR